MLKVSGGSYRGRNLKTPPGLATRPSGAKVRQALFNILGQSLYGTRLADLYAGPGTLGIEAMSRGAAWCLFVEGRREVAAVLKANLAALGLGDRARVLVADAGAANAALRAAAPLDLILADPPYNQGQVARVLDLVAGQGLLADGGRLVIEHAPQEAPPAQEGLTLLDQRRYGQTMLSFWARQEAPSVTERTPA